MNDQPIVATEQDIATARANALRRAGLTLEQLQAQARTGHFDTIAARLAWIVVKP